MHINAAGFLMGFWRAELVGGFNPFEQYARQIGSSPQVKVKIFFF